MLLVSTEIPGTGGLRVCLVDGDDLASAADDRVQRFEVQRGDSAAARRLRAAIRGHELLSNHPLVDRSNLASLLGDSVMLSSFEEVVLRDGDTADLNRLRRQAPRSNGTADQEIRRLAHMLVDFSHRAPSRGAAVALSL